MLAILSIERAARFSVRPDCALHAVVEDERLATIALLFIGCSSDEDRIFFVTDGKKILDEFPRADAKQLSERMIELPDVRIAVSRGL